MGKTKIKVDYSKCTNPEDCKICLGLCQPAVLILTFTDKDYHNPKNWIIVPIFPGLCIGCNLCVDQCPEQAISVKIK
jgi:NAD-dependent dihydropyrimidine dehydrogenase PreA subunit